MTHKLTALLGSVLVAGLFMIHANHAQAQSRLKACNDEWNAMKAAKQTAGKKYRDFQKECLAKSEGAKPATSTATAPAAAPAAAPKPATAAAPAAAPATTTAQKPPSPGREKLVARERACGAEWKADKAAGKVPAGMTWPKYWSACNTRKKAQGM